MIIGIGTDIVAVDRIRSAIESKKEKFIDRILSADEKTRIVSPIYDSANVKYIAKRFALKEAFAKATGLGIGRGVNFNNITIINDENGKPILKIPEKEDFLRSYFGVKALKIHISVSDEINYAVAYCLIEGEL